MDVSYNDAELQVTIKVAQLKEKRISITLA